MARKISQNIGEKNVSRAFSKFENIPMKTQRRVRKSPLAGVWEFIIWLVGILVALAVGFGMIDGTLKVPLIPFAITLIAGWIVVVLILLGVLLKIIDLAGR